MIGVFNLRAVGLNVRYLGIVNHTIAENPKI